MSVCLAMGVFQKYLLIEKLSQTMDAVSSAILSVWTKKLEGDFFPTNFPAPRGPFGSEIKKNWKVAAPRY